MSNTARRTEIFWTRVEEAAREIGVLLIAFAPLDLAFSDARARYSAAVLFFTIGVLLFVTAIWLERRRS